MTASETPQSAQPSLSQTPSAGAKGAGQPEAAKRPEKPASAPRKKPPIPLILLVVAGIAGGTWYFTRPKPVEGQIHVSGRIEGYETNVGPKIGGRVDFISNREGDLVKKGQPLVKISDDDIQAQLRGARARHARAQEKAEEANYQLKVIQSQIDEAKLSVSQSGEDTHAQVDQAEANVAQSEARYSEANAQLTQAKSDWELAAVRKKRFEFLAVKGAVSQDENDQAVTNESSTRALVESRTSAALAAKKQLKVAAANLNMARSSRFNPAMKSARLLALEQQLLQATHSLESARQDINDAKADQDQIMANIAYLNVLCPIDGVVTARVVEPGAVVVPGQTLISLINLDTVYLRGYVPEGQIGKVRVGQHARVLLDSSPKQPLEGTVIEIDPEGSFTPENIYFKEDRVKQVFGIKIGITRPDRLAKPGMPADAEIMVSEPIDPAYATTSGAADGPAVSPALSPAGGQVDGTVTTTQSR